MTMCHVVWRGAQVKAREHAGAVAGLTQWTEHVAQMAVDVCPIEEGSLAGSITPSVDAGSLRGAVSAGGAASAYAVIQHEALDYHHDPGKTAKYIENPANESKATGLALVAAAVKAALGG